MVAYSTVMTLGAYKLMFVAINVYVTACRAQLCPKRWRLDHTTPTRTHTRDAQRQAALITAIMEAYRQIKKIGEGAFGKVGELVDSSTG